MRRLLLVVSVALALAACGDSAGEGLDGELATVAEIDVDGREHVLGDVDYPTSPPAGGNHFFFWQNCGFYESPVIDEVAVHSLEHGAVWVTYLPGTDPETLTAISMRAQDETHLLASPYPDQASTLTLTAWGRQLAVDEWSDPAVESFLGQYLGRRSPTAPEAGTSCEGAIGAPPAAPTANYDVAVESVTSDGGG